MLIKLTHEKYSPWGLLSDSGDLIVWLASSKTVVEIDENSLNEKQLNTIKHSFKERVLSVTEASFLENIKPVQVIDNFLKPVDVAEKQVEKKSPFLDSEKVDQVLKGKLSKVLENLEEARKDKSYTLEFFQTCKEVEKMNKCRKTVVEAIIEIAIERLAETKTAGIVTNRHSGTNWLSDQYESLIELDYEVDKEKESESNRDTEEN